MTGGGNRFPQPTDTYTIKPTPWGCVFAMSVAEDLQTISNAVAELAFARIEATGQPAKGFIDVLTTIDGAIQEWDVEVPDGDRYHLGLVIGYLSYMFSVGITPDGDLVAKPVDFPEGNPVAQAAKGVRDAVLNFTAPTFMEG